jgi:hypothetical protein
MAGSSAAVRRLRELSLRRWRGALLPWRNPPPVSTANSLAALAHLTLRDPTGEQNMMIRLSLAAAARAFAGLAVPAHAAESVGQAASSAAKTTGHAIAEAGRKTGHGVAETARDVGHAAKEESRAGGHAVAEVGRKTGHAVKKGAHKAKAAVKSASSSS